MATSSRKKPQIQIWDALGELTGIATIFDDFRNNPSVRDSEERLDKSLAEISFLHNERLYEFGEDGRLKREATRKRAMEDVGLDLFKISYQPHPRTSNTRQELSRPDWHNPAESWNRKRKRSKSQPPPARYGRLQSLVEHAGQTMSGDSPGQRKARRHSKDPILLDSPVRNGVVPSLEIPDSEDSYVSQFIEAHARLWLQSSARAGWVPQSPVANMTTGKRRHSRVSQESQAQYRTEEKIAQQRVQCREYCTVRSLNHLF
jgi:hypothetical protein